MASRILGQVHGHDPHPSEWHPRGAGRGPSRLLVALLTSALLAGVVLLHPGESMRSVRALLGLGPERQLSAPAVRALGGDFAFAMTQPGSEEPVGWDPCRPVPYAVNPANEPAGGRALIENAIDRASAASGLAFEDAGETDRRPFTGQLVAFGERPVVIGWADPEEFPGLSGAVAGIGGGSTREGATGRRYYVTGGIALDTDAFTAPAIASSPEVMEAIVLHEVAHVIGLGHVSEPMELMFASNAGLAELGPGDLEGLARLGSIPCR